MDSNQSNYNTKVSDSAYSNSCSNSQSQRSGSSKSRHSGSNSSGGSSSGYSGKPCTEASNGLVQQQPKRSKEKDRKKKRSKNSPQSPSQSQQQQQQNMLPEGQFRDPAIPETSAQTDVFSANDCSGEVTVSMVLENPDESMVIESATMPTLNEEPGYQSPAKCETPASITNSTHSIVQNNLEASLHQVANGPMNEDYALVKHYADLQNENSIATPISVRSKSEKNCSPYEEGFCCIVSLFDGVVLFTSPTITESLGFPRDMWLGRSFIDFVHPKDRHTFKSQISSGFPFSEIKTGNGLQRESKNHVYVMLRKYRGLKNVGYGITGNDVTYEPYKLVLNFREGPDAKKEEVTNALNGDKKKQPYTSTMLMIISATPVTHIYKHPDEIFNRSPRFVVRHNCNGIITYVDGTTVSSFGYLPQDMIGRCIFDFFHPEDLNIIKGIYEAIVEIAKTVGLSYSGHPYRFLIQNGCYVTLDTEWSCFIDPWSRQLEFIIGYQRVVKGPGQIKIFQPGMQQILFKDELLKEASKYRQQILKILSDPVPKEGSYTKKQAASRCEALATFMETFMGEMNGEELKLEMPQDLTISERGSVMLGEISPHHEWYYDSKSSSETPPSYNQLNYNENLNRFFESKPEDAIKIDNTAEPTSAQQPELNSGSGVEVSAAPKIATERPLLSPHNQRFGSSGTESGSGSNLNMGSMTNTSNTGTSSGSYQAPALTEALLHRHNDDMEKLLLKRHRDYRATSRSEKNKKNALEGSSKHIQAQLLQHQQQQLQVSVIVEPTPGTSGVQGTKRGGSNSWEGFDHRTSKHQHVGEEINGNKVPSAMGLIVRPPTNLMTVTPNHTQNAALNRSPFTQQSASSLIRNIELWPPFSTSLPSMRAPTLPLTGQANAIHANPLPGMYRTMYYVPQQQQQHQQQLRHPQINLSSEHPGLPTAMSTMTQTPSPYAYQYMTGIMLPHSQFGQQFLYHPTAVHPMIYQPVPMATDAHSLVQPRPPQQTSIEMPQSLFMNSTGYLDNDERAIPVPRATINPITQCPASTTRPMFQRPPSQTTSTKGAPASSTASVALLSERCKIEDSQFAFVPDNNDSPSDSDMKDTQKNRSSDEMEESSYSGSLYSSFLRTDSSSNEESPDRTRSKLMLIDDPKKIWRRPEPPWLENVTVTSDLIYRYQKTTPTTTEVLESDMSALKMFTQPIMVNDQLSQLYLDLELEGLSAKLCLSEKNFSCSSEDEDAILGRDRRQYASLVMIYEENAPLPPFSVGQREG